MPFMQIDRPSIQLGLLKEIGQSHGFPVSTVHANLDFAVAVGADRYRQLAEYQARRIGEWLFSLDAFGDAAPDREARLLTEFGDELACLAGSARQARELLLNIRDQVVPEFLDAIMDGYPWSSFRVVGFSCTFQQNTASFALARRLKERHPEIVTVFGGANFDGEMGVELASSVECVDYAVVGEGDRAFPALLTALAGDTDPSGVPGVATRDTAVPAAEPLDQLDELPVPHYGEFFERAATLGLPTDSVWVPFESARGCWWGAKHHCTFCGLNGTTMRFRSKSPGRVLDELATQAGRHRRFRFEAVDNILDPSYLREVFPVISESGSDYQIFYEVKANLTRSQLKTLALGGVTHLQPGIESLSSSVLRLMDKGVRASQNVNLLRWARYYGIQVAWNILWGFPGETELDYAEQAAVVPHLAHLQPPASAGPVSLERFSPMYAQPGRFPLRYRRPEASHRYVYPDTVDLDRVAYFFDYELKDSLPPAAYSALDKAITGWSAAWAADGSPVLTYQSAPGILRIIDGRHHGSEGAYTFRGTLADIYLACVDRPTTAEAVRRRLGLTNPAAEIAEVFTEFRDRGLMFLDGTFALSLALPATPGR